MKYMDFIAELGVSAAHPGGFKATKALLANITLPAGARILEVGCGTGQTACYLAARGYDVTGVDTHRAMLQKAKQRSEKEGVAVNWVKGDILSLPFETDSFDIVFGESVTIFNDIPKALKEYYRVLKPNGRLIDREISMTMPLAGAVYEEIMDYFAIDHIPTVEQWEAALQQTGFDHISMPQIEKFWDPDNSSAEDVQDMDIMALLEPAVVNSLLTYNDLMLRHSEHFIVCVMMASKSSGPSCSKS